MVDGITTETKRKWQDYFMQAENDIKDSADFSAAKHCRMELLFQERYEMLMAMFLDCNFSFYMGNTIFVFPIWIK